LKKYFSLQRLLGATLLVFANKQDLPGALSAEEIKEVDFYFFNWFRMKNS
jgi:signal recognition particle receptor subunit beta